MRGSGPGPGNSVEQWSPAMHFKNSTDTHCGKCHSRPLEEMRANAANAVHVWAKPEIEQISRDVGTLKSFARATIERMKPEEEK